jgi:diacylglycerol kinase (ATP)
MPARASIIANPAARSITEAVVTELETLCRAAFDEVHVEWTAEPGHGTKLGRSSTVDGPAWVFSVGGDGTAREVVHGLAGNPDALMFIVPAGTSNSCFRSFWGEIPWQEALSAALAKPESHARRLDLARLAETGKLVLAGAATGFPPQAIHHAGTLPDIAGRARWENALLDLARTFEPYPGRVLVDGATVHSGLIMLANIGGSRFRGGQFEVLPHSVIDDGLLDVCVISGDHDPVTMMSLARTGAHLTRTGVTYARGREVTVERTDGVPLWFEHDGELLPDLSETFTLTVLPRAVRMLVGPAADQGRHWSTS